MSARGTEAGNERSRERAQSWIGEINAKPVCAFRIVMGAILIFWYIELLPDTDLFFYGLFPQEIMQRLKSEYFLSPLDWVSGEWWPLLFIALGFISSVFLLLGWRSRIAAIVSFICLVSIQHQNLLLWDGSDAVIRVTSFWLIFCPIDRVYSIDAMVAARRGRSLSIYAPAIGVRLLQLQVACIYLVSGWAKLHGMPWLDGTALHYALNLGPAWNRMLATVLSQQQSLVMIGTAGTLLFELFFCFFLFSPWFQPWLKIFALVWGAALHLLIMLTLKIGWFTQVMLGTYVLFFEPEWIDKVERAVKKTLIKLRIISSSIQEFDDTKAEAPVGYLQTQNIVARGEQQQNTGRGIVWTPAVFCGYIVLIALFVLSIRYSLEPTSKAIRNTVPFPRPLKNLVQIVGLDQSWSMFSPQPDDFAGYVILEGEIEDGKIINLLEKGYGQGGWNRRKPYYDGWWYSRWTQVYYTILSFHIEKMENSFIYDFSAGVCRSYNNTLLQSEPRLINLRMIMMKRDTAPSGSPEHGWEREAIYNHHCF